MLWKVARRSRTEGGQRVFGQGMRRGEPRRPVAVLLLEETHLVDGGDKVPGRDQQAPGLPIVLKVAGDGAGIQDQRPEMRSLLREGVDRGTGHQFRQDGNRILIRR